MFERIKATWNFWKNYNSLIDKNIVLPQQVPDYVEDLSDNENIQNLGQVEGKGINTIHEMKFTSSFDINIPAHDVRKNSILFDATKKHLIEDLDTPCWVCGSKKEREIHHFIVEMSLSNCIDWSKVQKDYPDFPNWHLIDQNNQDTFYFFYDDVFNMRVLCIDHHRGNNKNGKGMGIHNCVFPIWQIQKYCLDSYKFMNILT